jgi:hypothetical protein
VFHVPIKVVFVTLCHLLQLGTILSIWRQVYSFGLGRSFFEAILNQFEESEQKLQEKAIPLFGKIQMVALGSEDYQENDDFQVIKKKLVYEEI